MADLTVVYFTSNRERPIFEKRIRDALVQTIGDIPLISVSQQSLSFGTNICVGPHEATTHNALRQIQIGAKAATSRFVVLAESDFLYPRSYVTFTPTREDTVYCAKPVYVLFAQRGKAKIFARKMGGADSAVIAGREALVRAIETVLTPHGEWGKNDVVFLDVLRQMRRERFTLDRPAVTFKTDENMHRRTPCRLSSTSRILSGWGDSAALIQEYVR